MKHVSVVVALLLNFLIGFAQKKFEGTIIYSIHEGKKEQELTAMFGRPGIKLKFREGNEYDKEVVLINLDSGVVYTLNESEKTFRATYLKTKQLQQKQDLPEKTIVGYNTKPIDIASNIGNYGYLASIGGNFILYRSDSLFYPVPEKYSVNPELIIVNNNNIVLGASINMDNSLNPDMVDDSTNYESQGMLSIEAREIKWQPIDEKEFQVPLDYKKFSYNDYSPDSTALIDTTFATDTVLEKPAKPAQKPATKQNSKPKTKTKTTANKDIRKPK